MPTIEQINRINIPPEKYVRACDQTDLYELDLLIGKRLLQGESKSLDSLPEQSEKMNLKSVLEHCLEYGVNGTEGISIEVQNRIKEFLV